MAPHEYRGETPEEDYELGTYTTGTIVSVKGSGITFQEINDPPGVKTGIGIEKMLDAGVTPKKGDKITLFGSVGRPIHGQALNDKVIWYLSRAAQEEEFEKMQARLKEERKERFEKNRATLDAVYESLDTPFKERIDRLRAEDPDFRWESESYEIYILRDAELIANHCFENLITVQEFKKLSSKDQMKIGLYDGHSGFSFSAACVMANWYMNWKAGEEVPKI